MSHIEVGPTDDLTAVWDPEAGRTATVCVSEGRLEIVLTHTDPEWVQWALDTLADHPGPCLVIACPD